jgi:hypothetical protein
MLYRKEGTTPMGESLAIQQIGMALTQEEPVCQPIVGSSSVTVSSVAEVLLYGLALVWVMWWWYLVGIFVLSQILFLEGKFGLARELGRNENQNYDHK